MAAAANLGEAVRRLLGSLAAIGANRLESLSVDWREELAWLARAAVLGAAAFVFAALAIVGLSAWVIVALWDSYRLAAVGGVALVYVLAALLLGWRLRVFVQARPQPLATTFHALERWIVDRRQPRV
jgi:uncharacterized membrane protein YqjE